MFTFNKFNKFTQGIYQNLSKNLLVPASLQIDKKIFLDTLTTQNLTKKCLTNIAEKLSGFFC